MAQHRPRLQPEAIDPRKQLLRNFGQNWYDLLRQVQCSNRGHKKVRPKQTKDDNTNQLATPVYLTLRQAAELWNVSERTFHELRARGVAPAPFELGPRALRWSRDELIEAMHAMPRGRRAEPTQLNAGRLRRTAKTAAALAPQSAEV